MAITIAGVPDGGTPAADLSSTVQASLSRADAALPRLTPLPVSTATTGALAASTLSLVDCTSAPCARTLPAASSVADGTCVAAKKTDATSYDLTINRAGSDTIVSAGSVTATSRVLPLAGEVVVLQSNGTNAWIVVGGAVDVSSVDRRYSRVFLGSSGSANLNILNIAASELGTSGGSISITTPGEYPLSDSWAWDAERCHLHIGAGAHLYTESETTHGCAVMFANPSLGSATEPQRESALVTGSGSITGYTSSLNENALGFDRIKRVDVQPGLTVSAGRKGVTAQHGCESVSICGIHVPSAGLRGVSVEQSSGTVVDSTVRDVVVDSSGECGVYVTATTSRIENVAVAAAFLTEAPLNRGAVYVGGELLRSSVSGARIGDANAGNGVAIYAASEASLVEDVHVILSDASAVDFRNCTGLNRASSVTRGSTASLVSKSGTTVSVAFDNASRFDSSSVDSGESTIPRLCCISSGITLTTGVLRLTYFTASKTETVGSVRVFSGSTAAAATPSLIRIGLFTVAANGDLAIIGSTVSDTSLFASTNSAYTASLSSPVSKVSGVRYAVGILVVTSTTAPSTVGHSLVGGTNAESAISPRITGQVTGMSDLPESVLSASVGAYAGAPYSVLVPA